MTPLEVAALPVLETGGLSEMTNCTPWPGFPEESGWSHPPEPIPGLEVRIHGKIIHDYRRDWIVFSVHFKNTLVAVGRAAGRERDDSFDRWIVSAEAYRDLVAAVRQAFEKPEDVPEVDKNSDIGDVLSWYGETVVPGESRHRMY